MSLFAIADLHLSLGSDKPMDVFGGKWKNYVEKIKDGWYEAVSPEDTVVLIGDISWAQTFEQLLPDFALLESLPGRKIIIKGNHDYWWGTLTKLEAFLAQNHLETISFLFNNAYRVGDISVCGTRGWDIFSATGHDEKIRHREAGRLRASLDHAAVLGGEPVVFIHYPPVSERSRGDEMLDIIREYGVRRCYYGHIHSGGLGRAFLGEKYGVTYRIASADVVDFKPVRID